MGRARALWLWLCTMVLAGCGRVYFDGSPGDGPGAGGEGNAGADAAFTCAAALWCDDFETGDLAGWSVGGSGPGAAAAASTTRSRSGTFSLGAVAPGAGHRATVSFDLPGTLSSGSLALRMWISLAGAFDDFTIAGVFRNTATPQYLTVGGDADVWVANDNNANDSLRDHRSTAALPALDTWTCVELVLDFPGASPARVRVLVDDAVVIDRPPNDQAPAYDQIRLGVERAGVPSVEVFIDDVAIATQRIGCA